MTALGVLYNPLLPQGSLLDAIKFSETGHLTADKARTAVSPKGAVGPYQFMQKFHNFLSRSPAKEKRLYIARFNTS